MRAWAAVAAMVLIGVTVPKQIWLDHGALGGHIFADGNEINETILDLNDVGKSCLKPLWVSVELVLDTSNKCEPDVFHPVIGRSEFVYLASFDPHIVGISVSQLFRITRKNRVTSHSGIMEHFGADAIAESSLSAEYAHEFKRRIRDRDEFISNKRTNGDRWAYILNGDFWVDAEAAFHIAGISNADPHKVLVSVYSLYAEPWPVLSLHYLKLIIHYVELPPEYHSAGDGGESGDSGETNHPPIAFSDAVYKLLFGYGAVALGFMLVFVGVTFGFVWDWPRGHLIGWRWFDALRFYRFGRASRISAGVGCIVLAIVLIAQAVAVLALHS